MKTEKKRKFYITYGPPGSGKSVMNKYLREKYSAEGETIIEINVDKIIEENSNFRREIHEYCNKIKLMENFLEMDENLIWETEKIYWKAREWADKISTQLLKSALASNSHIIYETTGHNLDWFCQHDYGLIPEHYEIEILYIWVESEILLSRSFERAKKIGRIPNPKFILQNVKTAQENFFTLIQNPKFHFSIYDAHLNLLFYSHISTLWSDLRKLPPNFIGPLFSSFLLTLSHPPP